jgi:uncharacterized protein
MFLSGTLLNVATVLAGTVLGVAAGARMPARMQESLVTGLGLFTALIGTSMGLSVFTDAVAQPGDDLAVLGAVLLGVAIGELLRLHDGLEWLGGWFQRRLATGERPSRIAEGFVTASLVFCVGPLTILGSLENGLTGDIRLLAIKSLLDGVASVAFAAALGWGRGPLGAHRPRRPGKYRRRRLPAARRHGSADHPGITAAGGVILLGVALRLLDLKAVRVANFLPALLLAPMFIRLAEAVRLALS